MTELPPTARNAALSRWLKPPPGGVPHRPTAPRAAVVQNSKLGHYPLLPPARCCPMFAGLDHALCAGPAVACLLRSCDCHPKLLTLCCPQKVHIAFWGRRAVGVHTASTPPRPLTIVLLVLCLGSWERERGRVNMHLHTTLSEELRERERENGDAATGERRRSMSLSLSLSSGHHPVGGHLVRAAECNMHEEERMRG